MVCALPSKTHTVSRPRVLVAEHNRTMRDHVGQVLRNNCEVVGIVSDASAALGECRHLRPDVVLLDISMGKISGIEITQQLRDSGYNGWIVFLTVHEDHDFVNAALAAGGSAYVTKSRLNADLLPAIRAVLAGKRFVSPRLCYPSH